MAYGEVAVTCPSCQHRTTIPMAAVKRDNYYCSKCFQKVPMVGVRTYSDDSERSAPVRPKKSSRTRR